MVHAFRRRVARPVSGGLLSAALLAACGGGEIFAILQIVTPLAGQWSDGSSETINFLTPEPDVQVSSSKLAVTARILSDSGVCGDTLGNGVEVSGTVENGKAALRLPGAQSDCMRGSFSSLIQFDSETIGAVAGRSYRNSRVDVRMPTGLWVSGDGNTKLKFKGPFSVDDNTAIAGNVTGCDVSVTPSVNFVGTMTGYNTTTQAKPAISALVGTPTSTILYTQAEFVDGATLNLRNATGQSLSLARQIDPVQPDPLGTLCP